jgi:hypothetical protein
MHTYIHTHIYVHTYDTYIHDKKGLHANIHTHTHTPIRKGLTYLQDKKVHCVHDNQNSGSHQSPPAHNDAETENMSFDNKPAPRNSYVDNKPAPQNNVDNKPASVESCFDENTGQVLCSVHLQSECDEAAPEAKCCDEELSETYADIAGREGETGNLQQPQRDNCHVDDDFWSSCVVSDALRDFEEDMQERGRAKVYASRRALYMLHSTQVTFVV